ncbi:MAG: transketolase [Flavobacteriales bacterium]|nr:transketolase [Flavobacteriales bacterium]|tara:strand:+ start:743 stop:3166 length:2424 start_codon:yes stop_codon:yes gene_type:complete
MTAKSSTTKNKISKNQFKSTILSDYRLAFEVRESGNQGRRDVLSGKGSFGIFGDGKELAQIALSKVFRNGDFRAGYYRDQALMTAIGQYSPKHMFSALYGDPELEREPSSGSRQMMNHFGTRFLNDDGSWKNLMQQKNSTSDMACLASQFPRLVGLAQASQVYRDNPELAKRNPGFTNNGNEIAFATIGNSSCAEGHFWEAVNAIGVLQVPAIISIWDDGYGISVANDVQMTKSDVSEVLSGFQNNDKGKGYEIIKVKGWDYPSLVDAYEKAEKLAREEHIPSIIHVVEMTQPTGHSTSGSHERYKSKERLKWENDFDCITKFKQWIIESGIATLEELETIDKESLNSVKQQKKEAWKEYQAPIKEEWKELLEIFNSIYAQLNIPEISDWIQDLNQSAMFGIFRRDFLSKARTLLAMIINEDIAEKATLRNFINRINAESHHRYNTKLYNETSTSAHNVLEVKPTYDSDAEEVDGRIIIRDNFHHMFDAIPEAMIFGEDVGKIGGVNQGCEGLQEKFGESRVADTGIREATIIGQGIGLSLRGLKPIAEMQYLDYVIYGFQPMVDDISSLYYRTHGGQITPLIIRTRGHRLEGIWHSGSPMGMLLNGTRGMYLCVPRDMTRAAGFYNTLMQSNDPGMVIECLNGYRVKEKLPNNIGEFRVPIGKVETTKQGNDITLVTYGSTWRIVTDAADKLEKAGISCEVIDIQTLVPFDLSHDIVESLKKTNRLLVVDEDVPGGASAYILQKIVEEQDAYNFLDSEPQTLAAKEHRPPYGKDGDYFTKPSSEDVFEKVYEMMSEVDPSRFPALY